MYQLLKYAHIIGASVLLGTGAGIIFKGSGFYSTDYRRSSYKEGAKKEAPEKPAATKSEGKSESKLKVLLILLRSIGSTKAMELVQRTGNERFFNPFAEWVGGPDAAVRARLAAAFVMGMAVSREITGGFGLRPKDCEQMRDQMAVILQGIIDG